MKNTLLLGRGGRILNIISWQSAIELTYFRNNGDAVFPLEFHEDTYIRSPSTALKLPSVIMLMGNKDKFPDYEKLSVTKQNVLMRDEHTCQYCGKKVSSTTGTIDHVFPIFKGGTTSWRNVVLACKKCNSEKGHLMLDQYEKKFGKKLMRKPFVPNRSILFKNYLLKDEYAVWERYLQKAV
jgi:5-methylcytosine-specific restriction endonuclease McrA